MSARLTQPGPPASADGCRWPLRASDFDTAGHVNNSIHWAVVEDVLAGLDWLPSWAELEYHRPVLPGHDPRLLTARADGQLSVWLCHDGERLASAALR